MSRSSASTIRSSSDSEFSKPALRAAATPAFCWRISVRRRAGRRAPSRSRRRSSRRLRRSPCGGPPFWPRARSTDSSRKRPWLKQGITTVMSPWRDIRAQSSPTRIAPMAEEERSGPRTVAGSESELIRWMSIQDANSAGFIHGGVVMRMCDEVAGIAAIRHSGCRVVTAGMDRMTFALRSTSASSCAASRASTPPGEPRWRSECASRPKTPSPRGSPHQHRLPDHGRGR